MEHSELDPNDQTHELASGAGRAAQESGEDTRELSHVECWRILGDSGIAHLALRSQPVGVNILPINYLITNRQLFFKSAPGTKLEDLLQHPHVALQVGRLVDGAWFSVVVKGEAARLAEDADIERSGILSLVPAQPGDKFNYVRIIPNAITGRAFTAN